MLRVLLALFVLVIGTDLALAAADPALPKPDSPLVWRLMSTQKNFTTSRCLGDPKTPLCAAETVEACIELQEPQFCKIALSAARLADIGPMEDAPRDTDLRIYRVTSAKRLTAGDLPAAIKQGRKDWQVGDIQIMIQGFTCLSGGCETYRSGPMPYIIRPAGDKWQVIDFGYSNGPECSQLVRVPGCG